MIKITQILKERKEKYFITGLTRSTHGHGSENTTTT